MSDTATTDTDVLFRDDVDDIEEMPTRASRRIVTAWTVVFAALVVAGAGFVAGIQIEKRNAPAAAASGLPPGLRSFANGGGFAGGQLPAATTQGDAGNAGTTGEGEARRRSERLHHDERRLDGEGVDVVVVEGDEERRRRT